MAEVFKFEPDYAVPPGETLLETIEVIGMTQKELAERTKRPVKTISEIINGKTAITPETALQFEKVLGVPASFWVNLEQNYRIMLAKIQEQRALKDDVGWLRLFPIRELTKRGWIKKDEDEVSQLREVLNYFGVASLDAFQKVWKGLLDDSSSPCGFAFRQSAIYKSDPGALIAWLRRGQIIGQKVVTQPYNEQKFKEVLMEIRTLNKEGNPDIFVSKLTDLGAQAGVAIVFVQELPSCRVNGAACWLSKNKGLIILSLRYKTDDHLWFSFFHESAHILFDPKDCYIDELGDIKDEDRENRANQFAANFLIPFDEYRRFISNGDFSANSVKDFANVIGVSPGIVVGRLQHDKHLSFKFLNNLKRKYQWS